MQTAADITAPEVVLKLGGREVAARFDHNQMRMSEMYWQYTMGRKLGYLGVMDQAVARTYSGLGAIGYGAAASAAMAQGMQPIAMRDFDRMFDYDMLRGVAQQLIDGAIEALPKGKKAGSKKAESRA